MDSSSKKTLSQFALILTLILIGIGIISLGKNSPNSFDQQAVAVRPLGLFPTKAPFIGKAPPSNPPRGTATTSPKEGVGGGSPSTPQQYSIGEPTDAEQLTIEYLNRGRANPQADAARLTNGSDPSIVSSVTFWGVDQNLFLQQMSTLPPAPPLSFNQNLIRAARVHSQDMHDQMFQGHSGSSQSTPPNSNPGSRLTAQNYSWNSYAENVFAYSTSAWYGHAGFVIDWGGGTGGMQTPPGHRITIYSPNYREVGVGVVEGQNGGVGPMIITEDFASQFNSPSFLTGVVYFDFNQNNFYDLGEGVGGINVNIPGINYYAITSNSGGYSIPIPTSTGVQRTVTFSGQNIPPQSFPFLTTGKNQKIDFTPTYTSPGISGPNQIARNTIGTYTFTPVPGALLHEWRYSKKNSYTETQGPFHLTHPVPANVFTELSTPILVNSNTQLLFENKLGWATPNQVAKVKISSDNGLSWETIWSKVGTNSSGETSFSLVSLPLSNYAQKVIRVRFVYEFTSGSYFPQNLPEVGFSIRNTRFNNAEVLSGITESGFSSNLHFPFSKEESGEYILQVRGKIQNRILPWGPQFLVTVSSTSASTSIKVLYPNGGENWKIGSTQEITFETSATNVTHPIFLRRYIDNGSTTPRSDANLSLGSTLLGAREFTYTLPALISTYPGIGNKYKIMICTNENCSAFDESDGYFRIEW